MSESKVPLPPFDGNLVWWDQQSTRHFSAGVGAYKKDTLQAYGDARAAEARRLALLEAADIADQSLVTGSPALWSIGGRLRALADEASPESVSG